jgi:TusA-related sulfurtransferase
MASSELDCRGMNCPMPIVRVSRAMKELAPGDRLSVMASDPSFRADIEAWSRKMGQPIESFGVTDGVQTAVLVKQ